MSNEANITLEKSMVTAYYLHRQYTENKISGSERFIPLETIQREINHLTELLKIDDDNFRQWKAKLYEWQDLKKTLETQYEKLSNEFQILKDSYNEIAPLFCKFERQIAEVKKVWFSGELPFGKCAICGKDISDDADTMDLVHYPKGDYEGGDTFSQIHIECFKQLQEGLK